MCSSYFTLCIKTFTPVCLIRRLISVFIRAWLKFEVVIFIGTCMLLNVLYLKGGNIFWFQLLDFPFCLYWSFPSLGFDFVERDNISWSLFSIEIWFISLFKKWVNSLEIKARVLLSSLESPLYIPHSRMFSCCHWINTVCH